MSDVDGDGRPDIVVTGGASTTAAGGVVSGPPGVLRQDATRPRRFLPIRNLR